jgi:hypothetical protein
MAWAGLACIAAAVAQQGHPLTGTWSGSWGSESAERTPVVFVLDWDGKQVTGQFNPGPDSVPLKNVQFDPATWTIRFEADAKDKVGKAVHIAVEGRMENILSYHRAIAGYWNQGATAGEFKITWE